MNGLKNQVRSLEKANKTLGRMVNSEQQNLDQLKTQQEHSDFEKSRLQDKLNKLEADLVEAQELSNERAEALAEISTKSQGKPSDEWRLTPAEAQRLEEIIRDLLARLQVDADELAAHQLRVEDLNSEINRLSRPISASESSRNKDLQEHIKLLQNQLFASQEEAAVITSRNAASIANSPSNEIIEALTKKNLELTSEVEELRTREGDGSLDQHAYKKLLDQQKQEIIKARDEEIQESGAVIEELMEVIEELEFELDALKRNVSEDLHVGSYNSSLSHDSNAENNAPPKSTADTARPSIEDTAAMEGDLRIAELELEQATDANKAHASRHQALAISRKLITLLKEKGEDSRQYGEQVHQQLRIQMGHIEKLEKQLATGKSASSHDQCAQKVTVPPAKNDNKTSTVAFASKPVPAPVPALAPRTPPSRGRGRALVGRGRRKSNRAVVQIQSYSPPLTRAERNNPSRTVTTNSKRSGRKLEVMLPGSPYRTALYRTLQRARALLARREASKLEKQSGVLERRSAKAPSTPSTARSERPIVLKSPPKGRKGGRPGVVAGLVTGRSLALPNLDDDVFISRSGAPSPYERKELKLFNPHPGFERMPRRGRYGVDDGQVKVPVLEESPTLGRIARPPVVNIYEDSPEQGRGHAPTPFAGEQEGAMTKREWDKLHGREGSPHRTETDSQASVATSEASTIIITQYYPDAPGSGRKQPPNDDNGTNEQTPATPTGQGVKRRKTRPDTPFSYTFGAAELDLSDTEYVDALESEPGSEYEYASAHEERGEEEVEEVVQEHVAGEKRKRAGALRIPRAIDASYRPMADGEVETDLSPKAYEVARELGLHQKKRGEDGIYRLTAEEEDVEEDLNLRRGTQRKRARGGRKRDGRKRGGKKTDVK